MKIAKMVALGIVSTRLDYSNSLLYGMSSDNLRKSQVTQKTLARAVCKAVRTCTATDCVANCIGHQ